MQSCWGSFLFLALLQNPVELSAKPPSLQIAQNLPTQPDRDRFLQPLPDTSPEIPAERPVIPIPPALPPQPPALPGIEDTTPIPVQRIEVAGYTVFEAEAIDALTRPLEGRTVTFRDLKALEAAITQLYLSEGYLTSRAVLVPQSVDGIVRIRVIEGGIEQINIEGARRLSPSYLRSRIARGTAAPLNVRRLEDQLRLLLTDPAIDNLEPRLREGTLEGQSILTVRVTEANPLQGSFSIDNYSPPSVGSERLGVALRYLNPIGIGDSLAAEYTRSTTGGSITFNAAYALPLNAMDGTLRLSGETTQTEVTQSDLDIEGEFERYEVSYRQPLVRSPRTEFALSLGFTYQDGQTFLFDTPFPFAAGADPEGVSRTSVIRFGQDYLYRDLAGAWTLRSQFSLGTGLFDATTNAGNLPDSHFLSWLGQAQRVQRLGDDHLLIVQLDLQLTPDSLLASEKFVIGGGQSVRGYRQNARSGDNGLRLSIEDRITLGRNEAGLSSFQLAPFIDIGTVWDDGSSPIDLDSDRWLIGAGLGMLWEPLPNFDLRIDYGIPLLELDDRGTNAQDEGFYFSVNYQF